MRSDLRKVAHCGVAVAALLAGAAQRDVLHQRHMVADARRLADDDACAALVEARLTTPGQRPLTLPRPFISMAASASTASHPAILAGPGKVPLLQPKESCMRMEVCPSLWKDGSMRETRRALRASRAAAGSTQPGPPRRAGGAPQAAGPHPRGAG